MTPPVMETLRAWLVSRLAELRGIEPRTIDIHERFSRYGLDSLGATRLIADLSIHIGQALSPTLVWEHPTPDALARHLSGEVRSPAVAARRALDTSEPIAIVGMACRLPQAPSPEAFWR